MKSSITSAVLSAAIFSEAAMAATIGHNHGHLHRRAAEANEKRTVNFMSDVDATAIVNKGIKVGRNLACAEEAAGAVTVGSTGGAFVFEFNNKAAEDIIVTLWSNAYTDVTGQWGAIGATFIGAQQPDVTHTLKSNTTTWVSIDPTKASGGSVSGGFGAVYSDTCLTTFSGQLGNSWGEFTVSKNNVFSTTDISRLVDMNGHEMEIHNYLTKADADAGKAPACSSLMEQCSYVCSEGAAHCMFGTLSNCEAGQAGNTADASGQDGGCAGMSTDGGYVVVNFL